MLKCHTLRIQKASWTFWTILWTWLVRIFHFCDVHYYKRPFLLYFLNVYISQILKGNKEDVPLIRHDVWPSAHRGIPAVCQILSIHLQIFFFRLRNLFSHIFPLGIWFLFFFTHYAKVEAAVKVNSICYSFNSQVSSILRWKV